MQRFLVSGDYTPVKHNHEYYVRFLLLNPSDWTPKVYSQWSNLLLLGTYKVVISQNQPRIMFLPQWKTKSPLQDVLKV